MVDRLLHALLIQTLALSVAVFAVRAMQVLVVRQFGAGAAYLSWLLAPVVMLAVALPHSAVGALTVRVDVSAVTPAWVAAPPIDGVGDRGIAAKEILAAWAVGGALFAALLALRQRRFESLLAASSGGAEPALPAGAGPAVLGVWRRRIVLPRDFDSAFDAEERRLMLLHEGVHLRRADNAWNLLASALLVLHWFNPIAWWAWRRLRADQETSCDATVLCGEPPHSLGAYAGALLKVQGVAFAPPLATSWQSTHPLVERVRMLQVHRLSPARRRAGLRVAMLSILVAGVGGYALQAGASAPSAPVASSEPSVMTAVAIEFDKSTANPTKIEAGLLSRGRVVMRFDTDAMKKAMLAPFEIAYTATRVDGGLLQLDTVLRYGDPLATLASPRVLTREGEAAHVELKSADGAHTFAVTFVPKLSPPGAPTPDGAGDLPKPPALPSPPAQSLPAMPALPPTSALPPLPPAPTPHSLPALPPLPADPAPPPQRAL